MGIHEKLAIYPFNEQFNPILRHETLLNRYEIVHLISPAGWGLGGMDAGYADGGRCLGKIVTNNFDEALESCDTIVFIDSYHQLDFKQYIYPKIKQSVEASKNIICILDLEPIVVEETGNLCKNNGVYFKYFGSKKDHNEVPNYNITRENIYKINTPVIFVLSISEKTHKFEIQLTLRESLIGMGYKVSQVGTRSYSNMLGFHSFPEFMYGTSVTDSMKIVMFNRFIKAIEDNEKPDVMIIGIPGGLLPFNDEFTNRFGILAFEISNAVTPDASVLCLPYNEYKQEDLEHLFISIRYKLGFDIDCYNLSNIQPDWMNIAKGVEVSFATISSDFVDEKRANLQKAGLPIYNVLNPEDAEKIVLKLVDKLADFGEMQYV